MQDTYHDVMCRIDFTIVRSRAADGVHVYAKRTFPCLCMFINFKTLERFLLRQFMSTADLRYNWFWCNFFCRLFCRVWRERDEQQNSNFQ